MLNNIDLEGVNSCSSCGGCKIICPTNAIDMNIDYEGFFRPSINESKCINCGLCKKVCYKYYEIKDDKSMEISNASYWAGWSKNPNIRFNSSSGGVTQEILIWGLNNGYEIIGCAYNSEKNIVEHIVINNVDDLYKIQGSKYIQSDFSSIDEKIDFNKRYIVVGTPCQIYSINKIVEIKKKRENFIFIDFFCHGTPSYLLWEEYKKYLMKSGINFISKINFRYKGISWHDYSIRIHDKNKVYSKIKYNDPFLRIFLSNSILNQACYSCKFRFNKLNSDIKMGDFWGDEYERNKRGVNLIISSSERGNLILKEVSTEVFLEEKSFESIRNSQYHGEKLTKPYYAEAINNMVKSRVDLDIIMKKYFSNSFIARVKRKLLSEIRKRGRL